MSENKRNKILIVDDEEMNRELLRRIFEGSYQIITAQNGKEAIEKMKQHKEELAVILLDLIMPVINGYQVLQILSTDDIMQKVPIVLISANTDMRITISCYALGAIDVISKPFIPEIVWRRVDNVAKIYQRGETLENELALSHEKLKEKEKKLDEFLDSFLEAVGNLVEFRNLETGNHVKRVKNLTRVIATTYMNLYPEDGLTTEQVDTIARFSVLHDIGKIAISDSILLKPGKLNEKEWEVMESHTTQGCDILEEMKNMYDDDDYKVAYDIIRFHHEKYDGAGYPDGLAGEKIPLSAQLVSIADVFDSLINERVYKKAYSISKAFEMILNGECGAFSPKIIKCFTEARKVIEYLAESHA